MSETNLTNTVNYVVTPGLFKLDGGAMFGIIPKPLWSRKAIPDEHNRIELDLRLWLIRSGDKTILVDTGIGDYHGDKFDQQFAVRQKSAPLKAALAKLDLAPQDITDLIVSHLHFDHIGGLAIKNASGELENALPNARIHLHRQHWEYAHNPTPRDTGSFHTQNFSHLIKELDKSGKVKWLEGEIGEIMTLDCGKKIYFKCSHGHTPHLMHPYTDEYIYLADLIPTSNHVHIPWVMGYDIAPGVTALEKPNFLEFIHQNKLKMIFEHDHQYWGATLKIDERKRYVVDELFSKDGDVQQLS